MTESNVTSRPAGLVEAVKRVQAIAARNETAEGRAWAAGVKAWCALVGLLSTVVAAVGRSPELGRSTGEDDDEAEHAPWCGLLLCGRAHFDGDGGGRVHGEELWLREDGTLAQLTYRGEWSQSRRESEWRASVHAYLRPVGELASSDPVSDTVRAAALDGWDLHERFDAAVKRALAELEGYRDRSAELAELAARLDSAARVLA